MTIELKKGYYIDSYYDKQTRSYITTIRDNESNQIGDAYYSGNMTDRNTDIQDLKEIFYDPEKWEDFQLDNDKIEDDLDDLELFDNFTEDDYDFEESLDSKIKETKKKTKKSKLPALSTLSPIMPDAAAGIDTFNSGTGLSEEWLHRNELEARLKKMGFRYNFNRYTDEQLYRIYQERLKYLEKKKKEKQHQKQKDDEEENKRINSKDSFMKDGIEFESEDAAREYFGEAMENKFYLNDMHEAWNLEENDDTKKSLNEDLNKTHNFKTITEGLKYFDRKAFNEQCENTELELLYEGIKNSLDANDIKKLSSFISKASSADEINTYIKGLLSEDLDSEEFDINKYYKLAESISNYADKEWNIWQTDIYDVDKFDNSVEIKFIVEGDWKHDHLKFDYAVSEYLRDNYPTINYDTWEEEIESDEDYESDYYPGIHVLKLSLNNEPLTEARKPKYLNTRFAEKVKDDMEIGDLRWDNVDEWEIKYNGGKKPNPPFNTRELMKYFSSLKESLVESYVEEWWGQIDEDPYDLERFDLTVKKLKSKHDSTLYRFEGTRKDINKARRAGYFYELQDGMYSKDLDPYYIAGELVKELNKVGFELDDDVEHPIGKTLFGDAHLQVKNSNLTFPLEEADGDEELAFKLMVDDLKDARYAIEKFEDETGYDITFNFGPNKDMVITGGIDIR